MHGWRTSLAESRRQVHKLKVALRLDGGHDGTSDGPPYTSLGESAAHHNGRALADRNRGTSHRKLFTVGFRR